MHRQSTAPLSTYRRSPFETARRIGSLHQVAADIAGLRHLIVNMYFVGEPGSRHWVLVDAGLRLSAGAIRRAAEERFGRGVPPAAILLTHGHFDHVGSLRTLADVWDVPIYAHPLEIPYLTARSSYPPPDPSVGGGAMAVLSPLYPRGPINLGSRVQPLRNDGTIAELPEWRWFHTPGHSPGHVTFFREADRAMIVGDAFVTTRQESAIAVMQQLVEINGPPAYYTQDWQAARASVEHLASMRPSIVATGHGVPLRGERMQQELQELARNFSEVAVPPRGRYVRAPAIAGRTGTVRVPPRFEHPVRTALVLIGIAALVGGMIAAARAAGCCKSD